jgi:hypothetical protein
MTTDTSLPSDVWKVTINGKVMEFSTTGDDDVGSSIGKQYTKQDRATLTINEYMDFQKSISSKQQQEFKFLNIETTLSGKPTTENLTMYYLLDTRVKEMERNLHKYDVLDPFKIVYPVIDSNGMVTKELQKETNSPSDVNAKYKYKDIIKDYNTISIMDVANSSKFYNKYSHKICQYREDLSLSFSYFEKNVEPKLYRRVYSEMLNYDTQCHGGPLFFAIMIRHLTPFESITGYTILKGSRTSYLCKLRSISLTLVSNK